MIVKVKEEVICMKMFNVKNRMDNEKVCNHFGEVNIFGLVPIS